MEKMYYLIESTFNPHEEENITTDVILKSKKIGELRAYLRETYEEALESDTFLINGVDTSWGDEKPPKFNRNLVFGGMHPAIIVSNDRCNKYSPSVTIVPMTSKRKKYLPTHVNLCGFGLRRAGIALCEQVTTIDKTQITKKVGYIHDRGVQNAIHHAIRAQIAM